MAHATADTAPFWLVGGLRLTSIKAADTSNIYSLALLSATSVLVGKRCAKRLTRGMKKLGVHIVAKVQKVGTDV